ncbi:MAG: cupin domain-containing protein [Actinomycetota bacterium]
MNNSALPTTDQPFVLNFGEGEHRHFLNHVATTKIASSAEASMTAVEFTMPKGFGAPLHVHETEDEMMIVLEGDIRFTSGEHSYVGTAGATAWLPHGVPHTFQVISDEARAIVISAAHEGPLQFENFVGELGEPTSDPFMPEERPVDPEAVAMAGARNGLQILGPPPAMLV